MSDHVFFALIAFGVAAACVVWVLVESVLDRSKPRGLFGDCDCPACTWRDSGGLS
jgi:hypothetical protein